MAIPTSHFLERLKHSEGYRSEPYLCPAGFVTIGYGHNLEANPAALRELDEGLAAQVQAGALKGQTLLKRLRAVGMVWDKAQAETWLKSDLVTVMDGLSNRCGAYRGLMNIVAAEHAGKSEGVDTGSSFGKMAEVRAEVLIDMAFNMGVSGLVGFKRMLAAIEAKDYERAAMEMQTSKWAGQVGRRASELARQMRTGLR